MKQTLGNDLGRAYRFDLGNDVHTTSGFGHCQPIICREITAKSDIKFKAGSAVRLQPMVKPTFGEAYLKTYAGYVQFADLWHAFESFQSGKPYSGAGVDYIPTHVPDVSNRLLRVLLILFSRNFVYELDSYTDVNNVIRFQNASPVTWGTAERNAFRDRLFEESELSQTLFSNLWTHATANGMASDYGTQFLDYDSQVSFEERDYDLATVLHHGNHYQLVCTKFTELSNNLRKVFIGCGFQINNSTLPINFLKPCAFYKFWFDTLAPQRYKTWKNTACFGMLEIYEQNDESFYESTNTRLADLFYKFILNLCETYYYTGTDFVSAHITGTSIASDNSIVSYPIGNVHGESYDGSVQHIDGTNAVVEDSQFAVNGVSVNLVRILQKFINKNTAIGGKIDEFLRVHFGSVYVQKEDSYFIGESTVNIDFNDVMNMAETAVPGSDQGGLLGEYAGKGYGAGSTDHFSYHTGAPGLFVAFQTIVPRTRYAQGVAPDSYHTKKLDFYTPAFDGTTLVPSSANIVYGSCEISDEKHVLKYDHGFGNIPIYTDMKVSYPTILNGDMSKRSTRESYLPFTLDRLLPYPEFVKDAGGKYVLRYLKPELVVNSVEWRNLGQDAWRGNFNRIFYNDGSNADLNNPIDDNFIIDVVVELNAFSHMLPVSDSYDTDALDSNSSTVSKE